ncbi:hypothetical protein HOI71_13395, partial [Candidatus Poribacteria bacterium]|nr:hypothetical protein [Candidatus Poribacteria bacterium]
LVDLLHDMKVEVVEAEDVARKFEMMLTGIGVAPDAIQAISESAGIPQLADDATWNDAEIEVVKPANGEDTRAAASLAETRQRLVAAGVGEEIAADTVAWLGRYLRTLSSVRTLRAYVRDTLGVSPGRAAVEQVNERVRDFLSRAFMRSLHAIDNAHATGDQIVHEIARNTPPGHWVRIMGCQNIKGTGLDFVYRWISYDKVLERAAELMAPSESARLDAMRWFAQYKEYGVMGAPAALESLVQAGSARQNQGADARGQLEAAIAHVREQMTEADRSLGESSARGAASHALDIIEQALEARDSRKRRVKADGVLRELVRERISHAHAEVILRDLTKRQKGGWLEREVRRRFTRKRAAVETEAEVSREPQAV